MPTAPLRRASAAARALGAALALTAVAAGCDFSPVLDIETPAYERGLVLRAFLVADSAAVAWVGESWNPYEGTPESRYREQPTIPATVTLLRDGAVVERLTVRPDTCVDYSQPPDPETGEPATFLCGPYVGATPLAEGATYTVRVERDGWPTAEGTVAVPRRPALAVAEEPTAADATRRVRVRLGDGAGPGDRYGLTLYSRSDRRVITMCTNGVCRDSTIVLDEAYSAAIAFDTTDPVLLAAAREIAGGGISFVSFTDRTFDGRELAFTMTPSDRYARAATDAELTVQVAALSADVYDLYQVTYFSGGDENPFAEPADRPSNVVGGYGIVAGLALAEAVVPARAP